MRVLHVVERLDRGAVENWLLRMLGHGRANGVALDWTFYCTLPRSGAMDGHARELGAGVVHSPTPIGRKRAFARGLRAELLRGGYSVLHCHHDLTSAVYLAAAVRTPVRRRIVHVHNADETIPTPSRLKRVLYRDPMRRACLSLADRIVGISSHTLDTFLAGRARQPGRDVVLRYGVDAAPFSAVSGSRSALRRELGVSDDARILLFAGRLVPEKNPLFVLDVLAALRPLEPQTVAVFMGAGSLDEEIRRRADELGLAASVRYVGWRDDVQNVMAHCDWFVLPRLESPPEGFGLAVVEAQLAGLHLLLSLGVTDEPLLPGASFRRLALGAGADQWAQSARELIASGAPSRDDASRALHDSAMNMDRALASLLELYD